jgi:hypothetical protein
VVSRTNAIRATATGRRTVAAASIVADIDVAPYTAGEQRTQRTPLGGAVSRLRSALVDARAGESVRHEARVSRPARLTRHRPVVPLCGTTICAPRRHRSPRSPATRNRPVDEKPGPIDKKSVPIAPTDSHTTGDTPAPTRKRITMNTIAALDLLTDHRVALRRDRSSDQA